MEKKFNEIDLVPVRITLATGKELVRDYRGLVAAAEEWPMAVKLEVVVERGAFW